MYQIIIGLIWAMACLMQTGDATQNNNIPVVSSTQDPEGDTGGETGHKPPPPPPPPPPTEP